MRGIWQVFVGLYFASFIPFQGHVNGLSKLMRDAGRFNGYTNLKERRRQILEHLLGAENENEHDDDFAAGKNVDEIVKNTNTPLKTMIFDTLLKEKNPKNDGNEGKDTRIQELKNVETATATEHPTTDTTISTENKTTSIAIPIEDSHENDILGDDKDYFKSNDLPYIILNRSDLAEKNETCKNINCHILKYEATSTIKFNVSTAQEELAKLMKNKKVYLISDPGVSKSDTKQADDSKSEQKSNEDDNYKDKKDSEEQKSNEDDNYKDKKDSEEQISKFDRRKRKSYNRLKNNNYRLWVFNGTKKRDRKTHEKHQPIDLNKLFQIPNIQNLPIDWNKLIQTIQQRNSPPEQPNKSDDKQLSYLISLLQNPSSMKNPNIDNNKPPYEPKSNYQLWGYDYPQPWKDQVNLPVEPGKELPVGPENTFFPTPQNQQLGSTPAPPNNELNNFPWSRIALALQGSSTPAQQRSSTTSVQQWGSTIPAQQWVTKTTPVKQWSTTPTPDKQYYTGEWNTPRIEPWVPKISANNFPSITPEPVENIVPITKKKSTTTEKPLINIHIHNYKKDAETSIFTSTTAPQTKPSTTLATGFPVNINGSSIDLHPLGQDGEGYPIYQPEVWNNIHDVKSFFYSNDTNIKPTAFTHNHPSGFTLSNKRPKKPSEIKRFSNKLKQFLNYLKERSNKFNGTSTEMQQKLQKNMQELYTMLNTIENVGKKSTTRSDILQKMDKFLEQMPLLFNSSLAILEKISDKVVANQTTDVPPNSIINRKIPKNIILPYPKRIDDQPLHSLDSNPVHNYPGYLNYPPNPTYPAQDQFPGRPKLFPNRHARFITFPYVSTPLSNYGTVSNINPTTSLEYFMNNMKNTRSTNLLPLPGSFNMPHRYQNMFPQNMNQQRSFYNLPRQIDLTEILNNRGSSVNFDQGQRYQGYTNSNPNWQNINKYPIYPQNSSQNQRRFNPQPVGPVYFSSSNPQPTKLPYRESPSLENPEKYLNSFQTEPGSFNPSTFDRPRRDPQPDMVQENIKRMKEFLKAHQNEEITPEMLQMLNDNPYVELVPCNNKTNPEPERRESQPQETQIVERVVENKPKDVGTKTEVVEKVITREVFHITAETEDESLVANNTTEIIK